MFKSCGFWRLEFGVQTVQIGLPFAFTNGAGAFTFHILCFEIAWWRHEFRYERELGG